MPSGIDDHSCFTNPPPKKKENVYLKSLDLNRVRSPACEGLRRCFSCFSTWTPRARRTCPSRYRGTRAPTAIWWGPPPACDAASLRTPCARTPRMSLSHSRDTPPGPWGSLPPHPSSPRHAHPHASADPASPHGAPSRHPPTETQPQPAHTPSPSTHRVPNSLHCLSTCLRYPNYGLSLDLSWRGNPADHSANPFSAIKIKIKFRQMKRLQIFAGGLG